MEPSLLVYSDFDSPRLRYVLNWIFAEQLGITFKLTDDISGWNDFDGAKILYSNSFKPEKGLQVIPHTLLRESDIRQQNLSINRWKHSTILFYNQPGTKIPFDIFAAVFYLISRYEEYLPHEKDKHGRYKPEQSIASQYSFLQQPVVDEWTLHFGTILEQLFQIPIPKKQFRFLPTYDIDIAWKYLHKGSQRNWAGLIKDILSFNWKAVFERIAVNAGKQKDPFDCFLQMDELHRQYNLEPIYFMLLGQLSAYDKNADPNHPAMQALLKSLSAKYELGIHPSYQSNAQQALLNQETEILSKAIHKKITKSRQHYIKLNIPETYQYLINCGIEEDYSMGYPSANGFRAGTSNSFYWYDLKKEEQTLLRVYPFVFMEATSKFYLKQKPSEAWLEWERLWHAVIKVNGTFICIWHNYILGTDKASKGWPELYLKTLEEYKNYSKA